MAFALEDFCAKRPFLYHLTAPSNVESIRDSGVLYSACQILGSSGNSHLVSVPRRGPLTVRANGRYVVLRDQDPLHEGNIFFTDGMTFSGFVAYLNEHVFFWPGDDHRPNEYGLRHFARYEKQGPVILRIRSAALVSQNVANQPRFSRYNSGAPRCSHGRHSPRGRSVFQIADQADFGIGNVAEVVFVGRIALPRQLEYSYSPRGPWTSV